MSNIRTLGADSSILEVLPYLSPAGEQETFHLQLAFLQFTYTPSMGTMEYYLLQTPGNITYPAGHQLILPAPMDATKKDYIPDMKCV